MLKIKVDNLMKLVVFLVIGGGYQVLNATHMVRFRIECVQLMAFRMDSVNFLIFMIVGFYNEIILIKYGISPIKYW